MARSPQKSGTRARARVGRPEYRPTVEERLTVEQMVYCGESQDVIARALRIQANTLRKHFAEELQNGHATRRQQVVGMLFREADKGNVSAVKRLEEIGRVTGAAEAVERRAAPKEPRLGKKEQQQRAAEQVSGRFAPPPPPKLVVSNA